MKNYWLDKSQKDFPKDDFWQFVSICYDPNAFYGTMYSQDEVLKSGYTYADVYVCRGEVILSVYYTEHKNIIPGSLVGQIQFEDTNCVFNITENGKIHADKHEKIFHIDINHKTGQLTVVYTGEEPKVIVCYEYPRD